jgi:hypothetical protein
MFEKYNNIENYNPSAHDTLFEKGDLVFIKQDNIELFRYNKKRAVLILCPSYSLAGIIYYNVWISSEQNISILREDEIER